MEQKIITYKSKEYDKSVELRNKILRKPLGMVFTEEFLIQDEQDYILGLFDKQEIKAVLNLKPVSETILKMRQVAVDANIQGQGLGTKLVKFSEEFALENGFNKIELHARETAVNFYLKMNYKISGERFFEIGIPHFKMYKNINL